MCSINIPSLINKNIFNIYKSYFWWFYHKVRIKPLILFLYFNKSISVAVHISPINCFVFRRNESGPLHYELGLRRRLFLRTKRATNVINPFHLEFFLPLSTHSVVIEPKMCGKLEYSSSCDSLHNFKLYFGILLISLDNICKTMYSSGHSSI